MGYGTMVRLTPTDLPPKPWTLGDILRVVLIVEVAALVGIGIAAAITVLS
jgi:hypothetical protein